MAKNKTTETTANVEEFIASFAETEQKRKDAFDLLKMMGETTGFEPKMWGPSMIGFGQYHYKSERSTQEGDWFLVGFSPRKAAISLYVYSGCAGQEELLNHLGKFKMGKSCIYVNKLSDIDIETLKKLIHSTIDFLGSRQ